MGMDLVSRKPTGMDFERSHLNWHGWRVLGDILEKLGCDVSEMAGSNDGAYIKKATCKKWAKALHKALDSERITAIQVPDSNYFGGFREDFLVGKPGTLDADSRDWLRNHAEYFDNCGGCRQY